MAHLSVRAALVKSGYLILPQASADSAHRLEISVASSVQAESFMPAPTSLSIRLHWRYTVSL